MSVLVFCLLLPSIWSTYVSVAAPCLRSCRRIVWCNAHVLIVCLALMAKENHSEHYAASTEAVLNGELRSFVFAGSESMVTHAMWDTILHKIWKQNLPVMKWCPHTCTLFSLEILLVYVHMNTLLGTAFLCGSTGLWSPFPSSAS